jgi:hypothetical protein
MRPDRNSMLKRQLKGLLNGGWISGMKTTGYVTGRNEGHDFIVAGTTFTV